MPTHQNQNHEQKNQQKKQQAHIDQWIQKQHLQTKEQVSKNLDLVNLNKGITEEDFVWIKNYSLPPSTL